MKYGCQGEACERAEENQDVNLLEDAPTRDRKRSVGKGGLGMMRRERGVRLCTVIKRPRK